MRKSMSLSPFCVPPPLPHLSTKHRLQFSEHTDAFCSASRLRRDEQSEGLIEPDCPVRVSDKLSLTTGHWVMSPASIVSPTLSPTSLTSHAAVANDVTKGAQRDYANVRWTTRCPSLSSHAHLVVDWVSRTRNTVCCPNPPPSPSSLSRCRPIVWERE